MNTNGAPTASRIVRVRNLDTNDVGYRVGDEYFENFSDAFRYDASMCPLHAAYEADYCPICGTTTPISER